jgi:c-di-GMP-binding flagellar brake protein YcgR
VSFTPSGEPAREQRRDFFRLTVDLTVSATLGSGETEVELHVVNLSANGLLVDRPLADAGTLWLSIPIADGMPPIAPRGAVVRDAEGGTQGVRFDYISDEDQDRLVRFVMREQVRMRREGRL